MKYSLKTLAVLLTSVGFVGSLLSVFAENSEAPVPGGEPSQAEKSDRGPGGPAGGPRGERGEGRRGGPGGPGGPPHPGKMFEHADADGDGKVTKEEFVAAAVKRAERMFEYIDEDQSGDLTRKEAESARPRHGGRYRQGGGGPEVREGRQGERPKGFGGGSRRSEKEEG